MTKKHFKQIANVIKDNSTMCANDMCGNCMEFIEKDILINELSIIFKQLNPRFNKQTFINACNDTLNQ